MVRAQLLPGKCADAEARVEQSNKVHGNERFEGWTGSTSLAWHSSQMLSDSGVQCFTTATAANNELEPCVCSIIMPHGQLLSCQCIDCSMSTRPSSHMATMHALQHGCNRNMPLGDASHATHTPEDLFQISFSLFHAMARPALGVIRNLAVRRNFRLLQLRV